MSNDPPARDEHPDAQSSDASTDAKPPDEHPDPTNPSEATAESRSALAPLGENDESPSPGQEADREFTAAAFFDVDGTLVHGNIVTYYARMRTASMPAWRKWLWVIAYLPTALYYFVLDKRSRRRFNEVFYRSYARFSVEELEELVQWHFREFLRPRVYRQARQCIRRHHARGHAVVLVTGSVTTVLHPLSEWLQADEVYAAELESRNGRYTGELSVGPITDAAKVESVRHFARRHSLDLANCHAYADSMDDIPMLSQVGHAAVINPGRRLTRVARERGWTVLEWTETVG